MDHLNTAGLPVHARLLHGCCLEAQRADLVSSCIDTLRAVLPETFHSTMTVVSEEIRTSGRLLRDLADRSQVHMSRVPVVLSYLDVLLPCLSRSLRDINTYYEDKSLKKDVRWRTMYHRMMEEAAGLPLPQRFTLYNHFLTLLGQLLTRSPNFEMNTLELLQTRILALREKQGIAPPVPQAGALVSQAMAMSFYQDRDRNVHWAEDIFSRPLPCRTPMKGPKPSKSFGPFGPAEMPPGTKILFRRPFDHDRLSVMAVLRPEPSLPRDGNAPYLIVSTFHHMGHAQVYAVRGAHELVISREGSSLALKRWSSNANCSRLWAVLYFMTWEEMVLFYCSFVALKFRSLLSHQLHPDELKLAREKRLFQARILDDGYQHSLIVYKDVASRGLRLHAAVWDGELRYCPVWTAFVTHQSQSATWLVRQGKHRVLLTDIQLYVFCNPQQYQQDNMRQNKHGAFEIYFVGEEAARRFKEVFYPTNSPDNSEANEATTAGPSK